jgi:hypothetical protein
MRTGAGAAASVVGGRLHTAKLATVAQCWRCSTAVFYRVSRSHAGSRRCEPLLGHTWRWARLACRPNWRARSLTSRQRVRWPRRDARTVSAARYVSAPDWPARADDSGVPIWCAREFVGLARRAHLAAPLSSRCQPALPAGWVTQPVGRPCAPSPSGAAVSSWSARWLSGFERRPSGDRYCATGGREAI